MPEYGLHPSSFERPHFTDATKRESFERWQEMMRTRQRLGLVALQMEDAMVRADEEGRGEQADVEAVDLSGLPPSAAIAIREVFSEYRKRDWGQVVNREFSLKKFVLQPDPFFCAKDTIDVLTRNSRFTT